MSKEEENIAKLTKQAERYGHVAFDEAPMPSGKDGWIAYVGDKPGFACGTKETALRSAIAFFDLRGGR